MESENGHCHGNTHDQSIGPASKAMLHSFIDTPSEVIPVQKMVTSEVLFW